MTIEKAPVHVVPRGSGWSVLKTASVRATKLFDSKRLAVAYARDAASKQGEGNMVVIHAKDGLIQSVSTAQAARTKRTADSREKYGAKRPAKR